jgi:hypothetical protein
MRDIYNKNYVDSYSYNLLMIDSYNLVHKINRVNAQVQSI